MNGEVDAGDVDLKEFYFVLDEGVFTSSLRSYLNAIEKELM